MAQLKSVTDEHHLELLQDFSFISLCTEIWHETIDPLSAQTPMTLTRKLVRCNITISSLRMIITLNLTNFVNTPRIQEQI